MQLPNIMYYLLFFFLGYIIYDRREVLMSKTKIYHVIIVWGVFLAMYVVLNYARSYAVAHIEEGMLLEMVKKTCRLGYTIVGTMAFYLTAVYLVTKIRLPQWYISVGAMCFGVYIFQQFILQLLYYHTSMPLVVDPLLLPWGAFAFTLMSSILLTWIIRKTEFGRKIL